MRVVARRLGRDQQPASLHELEQRVENHEGAATLSPAIPEDVEDLAHEVLHRACERELKLATAESCTGGLLASLLTDVEGASHSFERGFVVYTEDAKCELLGLSQRKIDTCGVVSKDVALAMAEGAIAASHADIAVAVTGYASKAPDGEEDGLVHLACKRRGRDTVHRTEHFGDIGRGRVRIGTVRAGLEMLRQAME
jgi:nicotinamide-nucleotide amidase